MSNLALIIVIVLLAIIAFYKGKGVLFSMIVSFYPAVIIYQTFPYTKNFLFIKDNLFLSHLIVFVILFAIILFVMRNITHGDGTSPGIGGVIDSILLAIGVTILSVVLCYRILPYKDIYNLTGKVDEFFKSDMGYFIGLVAPIVIIYYMAKRMFHY